MTTIVVANGIMAADRRQMKNGVPEVVSEPKIFEAHGRIFGGAGSLNVINHFKDYIKNTNCKDTVKFIGPHYKIPTHIGASILEWNGKNLLKWITTLEVFPFYYFCPGYFVIGYQVTKLDYSYASIGSGKDYAVGAIAGGASATTAVAAASALDDATGDGVDYIRLDGWRDETKILGI